MRYKLVVFDFDGTLADTFPWFARAVNGVADRYGFRRVDEQEGERLRSMGAREIVRHLGVPAWKLPLIARHMRALAARDIDGLHLFDGIGVVLQSLAGAGLTLAVVSSNAEGNVRRVLGPDLASLISHYSCGASVFGKAATFRRVLRASGVRAAEAICIGDEIRDLEAARASGLAFGAVAWGFTRVDALRALSPDLVFLRPADVGEALAGPCPALAPAHPPPILA